MRIRLREVRTEKGMTIRELSEASGVSKSHINYIEKEDTRPTLTILCQLAKALNVKVSELFYCENELP